MPFSLSIYLFSYISIYLFIYLGDVLFEKWGSPWEMAHILTFIHKLINQFNSLSTDSTHLLYFLFLLLSCECLDDTQMEKLSD